MRGLSVWPLRNLETFLRPGKAHPLKPQLRCESVVARCEERTSSGDIWGDIKRCWVLQGGSQHTRCSSLEVMRESPSRLIKNDAEQTTTSFEPQAHAIPSRSGPVILQPQTLQQDSTARLCSTRFRSKEQGSAARPPMKTPQQDPVARLRSINVQTISPEAAPRWLLLLNCYTSNNSQLSYV